MSAATDRLNAVQHFVGALLRQVDKENTSLDIEISWEYISFDEKRVALCPHIQIKYEPTKNLEGGDSIVPEG